MSQYPYYQPPPQPSSKSISDGKLAVIIIVIILIGVVIIGAVVGAFLSIHPAAPLAQRTQWTDPNEKAFSVLIPKGWSASGGTLRPYGNPDYIFDANDPSGTMNVWFWLPEYPIFIEPLPSSATPCSLAALEGLTLALCVQGDWWAPYGSSRPSYQVFVWPYMDASSYISQVLLPLFAKSHPEAQLLSIHVRPDLTHQIVETAASTQSSGADALFSFSLNGLLYDEGVVVVTNELSVQMASNSISIWDADLMGASAPQADFSTGKNVTLYYDSILPTTRFNSNWVNAQAQSTGPTGLPSATSGNAYSPQYAQSSPPSPRAPSMDTAATLGSSYAQGMYLQTSQNIILNQDQMFTENQNTDYAIGTSWGDTLGSGY